MKKLALAITMALMCVFSNAQISKTINVVTPGTLITFFTPEEAKTVTELTITGNIDARDFYFMRDSMTVLTNLDIELVHIAEYKSDLADGIPDEAFYRMPGWPSKKSLRSIKLPKSITFIGDCSFVGSGLTGDLFIPDRVTEIGYMAFYGCESISYLHLPNSLRSIEYVAFYYCNGIIGDIIFPSSLERIDSEAFGGYGPHPGDLFGSKIIPNKIIASGIAPAQINASAFLFVNHNTPLIVPIGSKEKYIKADGWHIFSNIREAIFVYFNSEGGSASDDIMLENESIISKPQDPNKDGFIFEGWFKDPEYTQLWNFETDTAKGNTTIFAKWKYDGYKISFETNGGSKVDSIFVFKNTALSHIPKITKSCFEFLGWYKDADFNEPFDFKNDTVNSDITLYAKWRRFGYNVNFESNGGNEISSFIINIDSLIVKPNDPSRTGYTFKGWYSDSSFLNSWDFVKDTIKSDLYLYAKWDISIYKIGFYSNYTVYKSFSVQYNSKIDSFSPPARAGYTFAGWVYHTYTWYGAIQFHLWDFKTCLVTVPVDLSAKWVSNNANVSVRFYGYGNSINIIQAKLYSKLKEPAIPQIVGFKFEGWYSDVQLLKRWNFETDSITIPVNSYWWDEISLFSKWMPITTSLNLQETNSISIFPNPASDFVLIQGSLLQSVNIYNVVGELLLTKQLKGNNPDIDISQLAKGTYIVKVNYGIGLKKTLKLMKQ
jgi:uncharacterized repeat protein (TIGR02543 family)